MRKEHRNRGQVLVFFALALVALLGFAALGIDVGYMYTVRHELQRSADAGALAGASRFINAPGETGVWADAAVQDEARTRAIDFASKDKVVQTPLMTQPDDAIIVTFPRADQIMVQTERTVPLFFAKLFLGPTKRITAYAVAEAVSVSQTVSCVAPFGVPIPWEEKGGDPTAFDNNDILHWDEFYGPSGSGKAGHDAKCQELNTYALTEWSYQTHDNITVPTIRDAYLCPGALLKLKVSDSPARSPGWFAPLDLTQYAVDCGPIEDLDPPQFYEYLITNQNCGESGCRVVMDMNNPLQELDVLTGKRVGPTIERIAPEYYSQFPGYPDENKINDYSLMDGRTDTNPIKDYGDDNYWDTPHADWDFALNQPRIWGDGVTPRRKITVPIYDPRQTIGPGSTGAINPVAFAGFWIQDISPAMGPPGDKNATISARLIEIKGSGTGSTDPGQGGATVKVLRLVE